MPFYATALVVSDSEETAAVIDTDAIGFDADWTERILSATVELTGIPRKNIRFSCSHTHSGPNTFRLATISEGLDLVTSYLDALPKRVASAAWQAQQNLRPARWAAGSGACAINVNRRFHTPEHGIVSGRNYQGISDPTVRVVRIDDLDENPIATIVHYACHGTTMGWQTQLFTPDFPGPMRRVVENQLGGLCLFLQGAAANLMPRRGYTGDPRVYRRIGTTLGLEASRVAYGLETLPRRERFIRVMPSGAPIVLYEDEPSEPTIPWEMQCIRIGSIALLSVAGEPFIETANRIVAESPFEHTLFSGYSNGGFGYIPTREAYSEGGYEVEASPFSPDAADVVVEEGIRLLHTLAAKGASGI
jgi:hypothetical protein